ncbi:uncharacterized protein RCC_06016 [Ramularia collo-cygni]|uniref:Metallo-beta-lactamase domain-containing protein n=1 Tax=Ramularia collo-cygni TaxID=112498 RepID=A0A2D3VEI4_9PEZI|nr:uncharacterized protein RCC_06016 [Ramularia collo-cygni]CZT20159.1 uncharacterized protein RCC_06016 [Ramularia collo-cygni]
MSLTVDQLNADSTFILTFAPPFAPATNKDHLKFPGTFTILIDPWLNGESIMFHPKFASTNHTVRSSVQSLADVASTIDLIVVSQALSDHCHKATLCSLPQDTNIKIVATPKAAAIIQSWKYFHNPIIHVMKPYSKDKDDTVVRIAIDPYSSSSAQGEVTIANVAQKLDISGVHNAIGITYCPPGTLLTAADGSTVNLADMTMMTSNKKTSTVKKGSKQPSPLSNSIHRKDATTSSALKNDRPSTSYSNTNRRANYEKVLSVIYTPHGTSRSSLGPYVEHHLTPLRALPITALFHSMNTETNPWYMGGRICDGAPRAVGIAEAFGAKYWIGAHDEVKEVSGYGTKLVQSRPCGMEEARAMLEDRENGGETEVVVLGSGGRRRFEG